MASEIIFWLITPKITKRDGGVLIMTSKSSTKKLPDSQQWVWIKLFSVFCFKLEAPPSFHSNFSLLPNFSFKIHALCLAWSLLALNTAKAFFFFFFPFLFLMQEFFMQLLILQQLFCKIKYFQTMCETHSYFSRKRRCLYKALQQALTSRHQ